MSKLSIIIPNYNNEKYIRECLLSIISYLPLNEKIEIVIVDDGSTDGSCEIIQEFIDENDVDIKLYKNEINRGTGYSRNRGIKLASHEYLLFVDGDDMLVPEVINECLEIISSNDNEVVFFNLCNYIDGKIKTNPYSTICMNGVNKYLINVNKKEKPNIMFGWSSCRFIVKKDFLMKENIKFFDSSLCEDGPFVSHLYSKMNSISVVNKYGYIYRIDKGISPTVFNDSNIEYIFNLFNNIVEEYPYDDMLYYQLLYLCLPLILEREDLDVHQIKKQFQPILEKIPERIMDGLFDFYLLFYQKIMEEDQDYLNHLRKMINNKTPSLSIIIPTYNSEKYIEGCLESIIKDSELFNRIELIIVDDGSTDDTVNKIKKMINGYSNCQLIVNSKNKGSGYCRNIGIEISSTSYLLFVDNDDEIIPFVVNKALDIIEDEKTDVVFFDSVDLVNGKEIKTPKYSYINMFNIGEVERNIPSTKFKNIMFGWAPWHYIVSKQFISNHDIKFGKGSVGDDIYFTSGIYCNMSNISILNEVGYIHRIGSGISKNKHKKEHFEKYIEVFIDIIQNYNYNEMLYWEILYFDLIKGVKIDNITVKELKEIIEPVYSLIPQYIKDQMFYLYKQLYKTILDEDELKFMCFKEIFDRGMIR